MMNVDYLLSTMVITETDISLLKSFIMTEHIENEISENHLILYDFARDCHYGDFIQPDLINYLLPFYLKTIGLSYKVAIEVCESFTLALFMNRTAFINAIGKTSYREIINCYVERTIQAMNIKNNHVTNWLPLFNTAIAFDDFNFHVLLKKISESSVKVKYAFFEYLTILLFKERDNLVVEVNLLNEHVRPWWTSYIWNFLCDFAFWNNSAIGCFNKIITKEKIYACFGEISTMLMEKLGNETYELVSHEMKMSFENGVFDSRKKQFLEKISKENVSVQYFFDYV